MDHFGWKSYCSVAPDTKSVRSLCLMGFGQHCCVWNMQLLSGGWVKGFSWSSEESAYSLKG